MQSRDMLLRIFGALMFGAIACIDEPVMPPRIKTGLPSITATPIFLQPQRAGPCLGRVDIHGHPISAADSLRDGDVLTIYPCPPGVQRGAQVTPP